MFISSFILATQLNHLMNNEKNFEFNNNPLFLDKLIPKSQYWLEVRLF